MNSRDYRNGSMVGGVVLIVLGLVFFAVTQGTFNLNWETIWPVFPVLVGLTLIVMAFTVDSPQARGFLVTCGTIPLLVGTYFFATTLGMVSWDNQGVLWPIYPLIVGIAFIAGYFASNQEHTWYLVPGSILTLIGLVLFGVTLTGSSYEYIGKIWPLLLIGAGVLLMVAPMARRRHV